MEDVTIESLIAQGRVVTTPDLINPLSDYMVVGVYQKGTNKMKGDGASYKNYVISIAELLGGGSAYTASNGVVLIGNDFQLASGANAKAWAPDGNTFGAEKYIGTNDNFALPFRVNNNEVLRITNDPAGSTRFYFNATTNLHASNAGIQYSSDGTSPNRSQIRFNLYGVNTGAPGVTGFKSRGVGIGTTASVLAGDNLFRITSIGVSGNNTSINLASLIDVRVASVLPGYLATDFVIALNSLAGVMTERLYITSEGNVGMGTNNPTARLHVKGADNTLITYAERIENSDATPIFYISNTGVVTARGSSGQGEIHITSVGGIEPLLSFDYEAFGGGTQGTIKGSNGLQIKGTGVTTLQVGSSGVAIGTSLLPDSDTRFHVRGIDATASNFGFKFENIATNLYKSTNRGEHRWDSYFDGGGSGVPNYQFESSSGLLIKLRSSAGANILWEEASGIVGAFTNAGGYTQMLTKNRFTLKNWANISKLWMDDVNGYIAIGDGYFGAGSQLDVRTIGSVNAVSGITDSGYALIGVANTGVGVRGVNNAGFGIGIDGFSLNNVGIRGQSTNGVGGQFIAPMAIIGTGRIKFDALPISAVGLAPGELWNNLGVVNIV